MQSKERFPGFWGRFRFYLMGLAIGFMMLAFFQMAKRTETQQREAAAERSRTEQETNPNPLFPPLPEAERAKAPSASGTASGTASQEPVAPAASSPK